MEKARYEAYLAAGKSTKTTETVELAAAPSHIIVNSDNEQAETGNAFVFPIMVRISNPFLGEHCYDGSTVSPIVVSFTTGETSPEPPNTPIHGSAGSLTSYGAGNSAEVQHATLVNNSYEAPGVHGCGFEGRADEAVNAGLGLPSPAGSNTTELIGKRSKSRAHSHSKKSSKHPRANVSTTTRRSVRQQNRRLDQGQGYVSEGVGSVAIGDGPRPLRESERGRTMKLRCLGMLTAAAVVVSAVVASAAWAEAPEIGRCLSHAGGKYTNNLCTKAAKGKKVGSFEWEPGATKEQIHRRGGAGTLETVNRAIVTCKTEKSAGEITSGKTVGNVSVTFTGCESAGYRCISTGAKEGEIATNLLSGTLVWEKFGKKVAIDLVPQSTELFVEFRVAPRTPKSRARF